MTANKVIRFKLISQALQEVLPLLKLDCSHLKLQGSLHERLNRIALEMIAQYKEQTDDKFWEGYWALLDEAEAEDPNFYFNPVFEREHIDFAIRNAFFFYLATISVIPRVYKKQYGGQISPSDYRKASGNTLELAYSLSKFHFDVFRAFIYATSRTKSGVSSHLHVFDTDCFELNEDLVLSLSTKARVLIKEESAKLESKGKLRINQPTIGCPALFVKGAAEQDMLELLHQQVLNCLKALRFFDHESLFEKKPLGV